MPQPNGNAAQNPGAAVAGFYDIFIGAGSDRARNFIGAGLYADIVKQTPLSQWLASAPCLHAVTR